MNAGNEMARRYHWISESLQGSFAKEPHAGSICGNKTDNTLDMISTGSQESQKVCVDLAKENHGNLKSSICWLSAENTLDGWLGKAPLANTTTAAGYEMPHRLDWDLFKKMYNVQPKNYEELLGMQGVGAATVRALALVAELIHGAATSWQDPVKYSFAHGGKDGVPHPVARKVYDQSIQYLQGAIEGAEIEREERTAELKKLAGFTGQMFSPFTPLSNHSVSYK